MPHFLQSPYSWIVLGVAVIAVFVGPRLFSSRKPRGFKDIVKDPGYWTFAAEQSKKSDRQIVNVADWDDATVTSAVDTYLFKASSSREAYGEKNILMSLGTRVHAPILALLADKSRHDTWVKPTGINILPESPFDRACDLLGDLPPPEALPLLSPFLDDPSEQTRQSAAAVIGGAGIPEAIPLVRKVLADQDDYVRSHGLNGLLNAILEGRLHPECRATLYQDVENLLMAGKNSDESAGLLLALDPDRAKQTFISPAFFHPDSSGLHHALEAVVDSGGTFPRESLTVLIAAIRDMAPKYPLNYQMGHSLHLLGRHRHPDDLDLIRPFIGHDEGNVAAGATLGMLAWHGLEGIEKLIWDREESGGWQSLTSHQQYYSATRMLDAEVKNGGMSQYFANSSGDRWIEAKEGLKTMRATKHLAIFEKALASFGPSGPSTNRDERQEQLAKIARADEAAFDELDDHYYDAEDSIEVLSNQMILENSDQFR